MAHAVRRGHVDEEGERGVAHAPEASGRRPEGLEAGVDADREADLLGAAEDAIVVGVARGFLRHHEGRDEDALHAVARRALELALRLLGDAEGEVCDGDQAAAAVAAEVDDPAVVGARVGLCQLQILALGLPQDAEGRVEDTDGEVLAVEPLEALLGVPGAEARVVEVLEAGRRAGRGRDVADQVHRAEARGQVLADHLRGLAGDLEVLEAVRPLAHAERAVAPARLQVAVPQVRRLEDVAVGVDRAIVRQAVEHGGRIMKPRGRHQPCSGRLPAFPALRPYVR